MIDLVVDNHCTKPCSFKRSPLIRNELHQIVEHIWSTFDDDINVHIDVKNQFWQGIAATCRAMRCNIYLYCKDETEVNEIKQKNLTGKITVGEDKKYKIFQEGLRVDSKFFDSKVTLYNKENYDADKENKILVSHGYRYHSYSVFLD